MLLGANLEPPCASPRTPPTLFAANERETAAAEVWVAGAFPKALFAAAVWVAGAMVLAT